MLGKHKKGRQGQSGSPAIELRNTANAIKGIYRRLRSQEDPCLLHKEVVSLHSKSSGELSDLGENC